MKRWLIVGAFLVAQGAAALFAAPNPRIELVDGTVLEGEVLSFNGSLYTIRSATLGTITVEANKVRSIRMGGPSQVGQQEIQELQQQIMGNPEILNTILGLQDDPDVQAVLQDSQLMKAVQAGDLDRLLSSPTFLKLLQNPRIREIGRSVSR